MWAETGADCESLQIGGKFTILNSICTFGGIDKYYSVIEFQKSPDREIEAFTGMPLMVSKPALGTDTAPVKKIRPHLNDKGKSEMEPKLCR